jgi:uroporphyrinogen decarboxylase
MKVKFIKSLFILKESSMSHPKLEHPQPDFDTFVAVLKGEQLPRRVHLIELSMDGEIMKALTEQYLEEAWFNWEHGFEYTPPEEYYQQVVNLYYWLGYDHVPIWATWPNHPAPDYRKGDNTAELASGQRSWIEQSSGLINSWQDFEKFPWDALQPDTRPVEWTANHLPDGMKMTVNTTYFEHLFENLLGLEAMAYMMADAPELLEAVFERWGEKVYAHYAAVIDHEKVGGIFHADDMGFKTSTLISPKALRRLVLPWHKRFAELAHQHGKIFCIHSDGNLYKQGIIEDLIEDVKIDGFHAFEEIIVPVTQFKEIYGERVGTLGGVDMDRIVRLEEPALRGYIREILDRNMPGGRYALGTGNTVANYVPIKNYLILLEESRLWNKF